MIHYLSTRRGRVYISAAGIAAFNRTWPCSPLKAANGRWFEYGNRGELVGHNFPENPDADTALAALAEDCGEYAYDYHKPQWWLA